MNTKQTFEQISKKAFIVGGIGAALCAFGWWKQPEAFANAYLVAWLYVLGLTVGCFPLTMIGHLTWGGWSFVIRRTQEAVLKALPLCALLFIPVACNLRTLYIWIQPNGADLDIQKLYLNAPFFLVRFALYFAIWIFLACKLRKHSSAQDETPSSKTLHRLTGYGGVGLVAYAMTVTFGAFDWGMSLEPHWYSTIYGAIFGVHFTMSALAFAIIITVFLSKENGNPMQTVLSTDRLHDLGTLLFATVMLWAYTSVSQLIIIWSANQPHEAAWYIHRSRGGWEILVTLIFLLQFVTPFFALLMRFVKRKAERLVKIACLILVIRWFDLIWQIKPTHYPSFNISWLDFACWITLGSIWLGFALRQLANAPTLTFKQDPIWNAEDHH